MLATTVKFQLGMSNTNTEQLYAELCNDTSKFKDYWENRFIEIENFNKSAFHDNNLFLTNIDFRLLEAKSIIRSVIETNDVENPFIKEFFFHKEFFLYKNEIWFLRPFLYLDIEVMQILLDIKSFDEMIEKVNYSEYEQLLVSATCNVNVVNKDDCLSLYHKLQSSHKLSNGNFKEFYYLLQGALSNHNINFLANGE